MDYLAWTIGNRDPMHGVCVFHTCTQDTSRMGTARVKQEEEADTRTIARKYSMKYGRKGLGHYMRREKSQTGLTSDMDLTMELPFRNGSPPTQ